MITRLDLALINEAVDLSTVFVKALNHASITSNGTIIVTFEEDDDGYSKVKDLIMKGVNR